MSIGSLSPFFLNHHKTSTIFVSSMSLFQQIVYINTGGFSVPRRKKALALSHIAWTVEFQNESWTQSFLPKAEVSTLYTLSS